MWHVGILGAGYIADHHVRALKLLRKNRIIAICDRNLHQAHLLKKVVGNDVVIYSTLERMLSDNALDVVHVLLPPDLHFSSAEKILQAGKHVFLEKPMATDVNQCARLCRLAESIPLGLGVSHNFLFFDVYKKLKEALKKNEIGPLDHLSITWHKTLGQLHTGPFNIWMLRDPGNLIIEIGPHLIGCLLDLVGNPAEIKVEASDPLLLPSGVQIYRRWWMMGHVGKTCVELQISLGEGFDTHMIEAHGRIGVAKVDFEKNTFNLVRHTDSARPLDLYKMVNQEAYQTGKWARKTLGNYILSKFKLFKAGDPYFASLLESIRTFYDKMPLNIDPVQTGHFSTQIIDLCQRIVAAAGIKEKKEETTSPTLPRKIKGEILITGGTGFIGKALVRLLTSQNKAVRLLVRNPDSFDRSLLNEQIEIVQGDLRDRLEVKEALKGIKTVYHLARGTGKTWEEYDERGLRATQILAEECMEAKVTRFVYTGTIDSYYAGDPHMVITEDTPLDPQIECRNFYARCKAAEETLLKNMEKEKGLPLVIFRPGIVLGSGSSPFHWGVGMWHYGTVCQLWGKGENPLPFVWVDDVARALIQGGELPQLEGHSFNLVDAPCLSGKEYAFELAQALQSSLEIKPTSIWKFYLYDMFKWVIKVMVRHPQRKRPSYRDWASRTQASKFDCSKAKNVLYWNPLADRAKLVEEGIYNPVEEWMK